MSESESARSPWDITVAIPTYNGADRLPRLLDRLKSQKIPDGLRWEVLIVDNNSQDATARVVQQYQADWLPEVPLRYQMESRQGAAFARQTAVRVALGNLVGFLDDDNLPTATWVAEAVNFSRCYPRAGAFSGRIHGSYEATPPEGFDNIKAFLAIRDHGTQVIPFEPEKLRLPPAASLVVRQSAWLSEVPEQPIFLGRLPGAAMLGGEDYEVLLHLYKGGWDILYNPALETYHQIPPQRFERDYLLRLARGCGLSTCQLALILADGWQKPVVTLRTIAGSLRRLLAHVLKHRGRVRADLLTAFQFEFHLGSLLSPFYVRRWY